MHDRASAAANVIRLYECMCVFVWRGVAPGNQLYGFCGEVSFYNDTSAGMLPGG